MTGNVKLKPKKCKAKDCGKEFIPVRPLQIVCSPECSRRYSAMKGAQKQAKEAKLRRKEYQEEKKRIRSRADWIKDAQQAVNAYIRARDYGKPCISCGRATKSGDHAGHWKPTSSSPELRFNPDNIHLQCIQCNLHLHGNVANYRIGLIDRIGIKKVKFLERKHEPCKWTIEELREIKAEYSKMAKELKNAQSA